MPTTISGLHLEIKQKMGWKKKDFDCIRLKAQVSRNKDFNRKKYKQMLQAILIRNNKSC